jgi:hypothetical protein
MALFSTQILYLSLLVCVGSFYANATFTTIWQIKEDEYENIIFMMICLTQLQNFLSMTGFSESIGTIAMVAVKVINSLHTIS